MPSPTRSPTPSTPAAGTPRGTWLVVGLVLLGLTAAMTGIWFQRHQTHRCLEFYGAAAARRIAAAPTVELLLVRPGATPRRLTAHTRIDVSKAPGLVHLRRGLVEDANFNWQAIGGADGVAAPRLPLDAWDVAFVFTESGGTRSATDSGDQDRTTLVIDFDPTGGALATAGQPGRIGLGRIGAGLEKWVRSTLASQR